ncbi:MAG TPA: pentapeptide repeat-containing protein, partial [Candidatus Eisenbacteria bacterium]|nr:pentapeptide repeat-containing protein [Candidatus Eisenbacteria bacterium]
MLRPRRAAVVPRALSPTTGDPLALEDLVRPYLGQKGAIAVLGPAGSGRTTALAHLAAALGRAVAVLDDDADVRQVSDAAGRGLAVYARGRIHPMRHLATLVLAPWGRDEALEYMMALHRDGCGAVMPRLFSDPDVAMLDGTAELWRAVLERMAAGAGGVADALAEIATRARKDDPIHRHRAIRTVRRAYEIALEIRGPENAWLALGVRQEPEVLRAAAKLLAGAAEARDVLAKVCEGPADERQPMVASLLLLLDPLWKPKGVPRLDGAHLPGARWRAVELPDAVLKGANLAGADLDAAILDRADAQRASFRGARLRGASFRGARLERAAFGRADFAGACLA